MAAKMSELLQWRLEYQIQKVINISLAIIPKVMSLGSSQFYTVLIKCLSSSVLTLQINGLTQMKIRRTAEAIKGVSFNFSDISYEIDNLMYSGCLSISDKPMPLLSFEFYRLMEAT